MAQENGLLGIGELAALTGLTITALRHYHRLGLLVPDEVDEATGYRRYRPAQAQSARLIRALRSLQLPLEEIERLLRADGAWSRRIWAAHRRRLEDRIERCRRGLAHMDEALRAQGWLTAEGITSLLDEEEETMTEPAGNRMMGVTLSVPDVDGAARFYEQVFGFGFEAETHPGGPRHLHACGGTWNPQEFFLFTLWPGEARRAAIDFTVDDVDACWRKALDAGAEGVRKPYDSGEYPRHAAFTDPFGNRVNVYAS